MRRPEEEDSFLRESDKMWLKMKPLAQDSISDRDKFFLRHWTQNDAEVYPAFYLMNTGKSFPAQSDRYESGYSSAFNA